MRLAFRELPERQRQTTGTKLREAHTALMANRGREFLGLAGFYQAALLRP